MGIAKIVILYLCMSSALVIGTYDDGTGTYLKVSDMLTDFLQITGTGEAMMVEKGGALNQSITDTQIAGGAISESSFLVTAWDSLRVVWSFFVLLFDLWWIPVGILIEIQAPFPIILMMAALPVTFIIYLIAFIRGGVA